MKAAEILKAIESLDKTSEDFFNVYSATSEKYWDVDVSDPALKARKLMHHLSNTHEDLDWMVEITMMVANNLFKMVEEQHPAVHGSFGVKGKEYHFDFYTDKSALTNLEKMLRHTVIKKANEVVENERPQEEL